MHALFSQIRIAESENNSKKYILYFPLNLPNVSGTPSPAVVSFLFFSLF